MRIFYLNGRVTSIQAKLVLRCLGYVVDFTAKGCKNSHFPEVKSSNNETLCAIQGKSGQSAHFR
jgi:hypothetical protein